MNGGLLPGCIYLLEYSNYTYIRYSKETKTPYLVVYYLKNYGISYNINLN